MADPVRAGRSRLNVVGTDETRKRRIPRMALYLGVAAVIISLTVILLRASPHASVAVSAGVKALMAAVCLAAAVLARNQPRQGRGIPMWLQWMVLAALGFTLAVLQVREALE